MMRTAVFAWAAFAWAAFALFALTGCGGSGAPLNIIPPPPSIGWSGPSDFGTVAVDDSEISQFRISNNGKATLVVPVGGYRISGPAAEDFSVSASALWLGSGGSQTVAIVFAPSATGLREATLTITPEAPAEMVQVPLRGIGVLAGPLSLLGTDGSTIAKGSLTPSVAAGTDFGEASVALATIDTYPTRLFTVVNDDDRVVTVSGLQAVTMAAGGSFVAMGASPFPLVLAANGGSASFEIGFIPTEATAVSWDLALISDHRVTSSYRFRVTGTGIETGVETEAVTNAGRTTLTDGASFDLGAVVRESTRTQEFAFVNLSADTVSLGGTAVDFSGDDADVFSLVQSPATSLNTGQEGLFTIGISPSVDSPATLAAIMTLRWSTGGQDYERAVTLSATVIEPDLRVADDDGNPVASGSTTASAVNSTDLGVATVGASINQVFELSNSSAGKTIGLHAGDPSGLVQVLGTGSAAYAVTADSDPAPLSLTPGASWRFVVTFTPTEPGSVPATVRIAPLDAVEPEYSFAIKALGNGSVPTLRSGGQDLAIDGSAGIDFGAVDVVLGSLVTATIQVGNSGNTHLVFAATPAEILGGASGDFSLGGDSLATPIAAGASRSITVTFDPEQLGNKIAQLRLNMADHDPILLELSGSGVDGDLLVRSESTNTLLGDGATASVADGTAYENVNPADPDRYFQFIQTNASSSTRLYLGDLGAPTITGHETADLNVVVATYDTGSGNVQLVYVLGTAADPEEFRSGDQVAFIGGSNDAVDATVTGAQPDLGLASLTVDAGLVDSPQVISSVDFASGSVAFPADTDLSPFAADDLLVLNTAEDAWAFVVTSVDDGADTVAVTPVDSAPVDGSYGGQIIARQQARFTKVDFLVTGSQISSREPGQSYTLTVTLRPRASVGRRGGTSGSHEVELHIPNNDTSTRDVPTDSGETPMFDITLGAHLGAEPTNN
ncbi:MAG: choice-of-anchor D domain-containing protein [Planctomycetota bacterium]|jgi:hypothetical protein|nr:choice-of-anchor D domain-containing protein [Planctomycetota bacterium]